MQKITELINTHKKEIDNMLILALKQYGGLGGLKNIKKVELTGEVFWKVVNSFDKIIADIPKAKPVKVEKKKTNKKKSK